MLENETVAGWVEHDTKIRNAMPLNPTAQECEGDKALPLHPAAEAALLRGKKRRGVKRYAGIGAQSSCVDQVIFGRDMDFTTLGDDTDVKAYEGSAGLPSRNNLKAGGVKKMETLRKDTALVHTAFGVTVQVQERDRRGRQTAASPFNSPGVAEVLGYEPPGRNLEVQAWNGAAGARPKSPRVKAQDTSRPTNLVAAVVFGEGGPVPENNSLADSRKKRVDPSTETFADLAGRTSAELHEHRGKRLVAWPDGRASTGSSGSAGCPSSSLGDQLAGWHPEARDRLKKTAAGFEEPHSAMNCMSDKVLYCQASPRHEPLWTERKANVHRQVPGRKHLGSLGMPFMEQQADIFAARSVTPPPQRAAGTPPRSRINGPDPWKEWDLPRPSRSITPPRTNCNEIVHGMPSHAEGRRLRSGGRNPAFGASSGLYRLPALPKNEHPAASGGSTTDL